MGVYGSAGFQASPPLPFRQLLQETEHIAGWSTHFWQRPKHQLTLLGCYGRNTSLSFIDMDEYMVLPNARSIHDAQCLGRPLLDPDPGGPRASFVFARYVWYLQKCH